MFTFTPPQPRQFSEGPRASDQIAKIAALLEPRLRRAFLQAVAGMGEAIALRTLINALASGGMDSAVRVLAFKQLEILLADSLTPLLREGLNGGAQYAAAKIRLRFDLTNPDSLRWIENHGAELVRGISDQSRLAVRSIIRAGYQDGLTPTRMAKQIRAVIGLNESQAKAVTAYRRGLLAKGITEARIDTLASDYAGRLLRQRARVIAVNESLVAAREGQRRAWGQAAESGLLNPTRTQKKWLASLSPCARVCESMAGQIVGLFEQFVTGLGDLVDGPPAHVTCRCSSGLVFSR